MPLLSFGKKVIQNSLTIKGKLLLSALGELLLVLIFSVFLVISSRQVNNITASETRASNIVQTITEIRFVTFENLLHHDERSYNQWLTKHQQLGDLLNAFPATSDREKKLIDTIQTQHNATVPVFSKLVFSYSQPQPASEQKLVAQNQYQERLASQLVSKQQIEISAAFKLANLKRAQAAEVRQQTRSIAVAVILLMFLITAGNFIFVYRSITRALAIFHRGAGEVSRGNFDYRIHYKRKTDEFGEMASTFNKMAMNLQEVDRLKSEFVLLVSHQLRTPATAVKGFLSLLAEVYNSHLSPKQVEFLSSAYEENERQIKLINEILAVAQVETGEMVLHKQPTDMLALVKAVVVEQHLAMTDRGQKVKLKMPERLPKAMVDTAKIHIVIENLLHNASKFSANGTTIEVEVNEIKGAVVVSVKDYGAGIAEEDLGKLFKKFSRVSSATTVKTEGTGLGLYLAKRIVDLHQGTIGVSSVVGQGSIFTVQLPNNIED